MVQTGAKIQFGGEKKGLFKVAYQVGIADVVNNDPTPPAPKQRAMDKISLGKSLSINISITEKEILYF